MVWSASIQRIQNSHMRATDTLYTILRNLTEDHVALMLDRAYISLPITTPAEALELIQRAVDVVTGEDDAAEFQDEQSISSASPANDE